MIYKYTINNKFDLRIYNQVLGTAMGTECAPPYVSLTIGFKEKDTILKIQFSKYFTLEDIETIELYFKRHMSDQF